MFNLKKIVSAVIAGAMVLSTLPMAYATTDPVLLFEDFQGADIASKISNNTETDYRVTRVADKYGAFELATEDDNQYIVLKDQYPVEWEGYNYGRLNVVMEQNSIIDKAGTFAVETKFQIPTLAAGAKYYPITAFYSADDYDLTKDQAWNRGKLARFVYVQGGEFKVSDHIPENTAETAVADTGTVITTAKAGKWYTLKLTFDIDGDADTVDTFRYELTDGVEVFAGNGGAIGNGVGNQYYPITPAYNLTSLNKLAFGYIWDETSATPTEPTTIYLDDICIREVADEAPITLESSVPAANATDVAADAAIELTFSEAVTEESAQNIKITPAVDATIAVDGETVTITPEDDFAFGKEYTVTIPYTVKNADGLEVLSESFKFTVEEDPDQLFLEDFESSTVADKVGTGTKDLQVTRVADGSASGHFEFVEEDGNTYLKLMDKYVQPGQYDYGRLNVDARANISDVLTGGISVETKFQIPELRSGATYYPITAYYEEADLAGAWNRGLLARFVYVAKEGDGFSFKVSTAVPADTSVTDVTNSGTTVAAAEAGKWYTLKLILDIDGEADTIDTFTYKITDGTNIVAEGNGGAIGNKVGSQGLSGNGAKYNLTSLHKLSFGYIWDETTASEADPTTIYLDDINVRKVEILDPITLESSDPAANATDVAVDKTIKLTFSEAVTEASAQNITLSHGAEADITVNGNTVTIDPTADLAFATTYTVTIPSTVVSSAGAEVTPASFTFTTVADTDSDLIMSENFEAADVASKIATGNRDAAYTVTRVSDLYAGAAGFSIETDATGNKYLKLNDIYGHLSSGSDVGRCNIAMEYNTDMNLTGRFAVETKFQIPSLVDGAKYYPITAFYDETDLAGSWNRGNLARFVYVQKEGDGFSFKVSEGVPADTTVTTVIDNGTTIAAAEAGKWYTLKLNFNIDGNAETIDTFTYELTDGTNTYSGMGGAVGNKVGYQSIITDCKYNLTSLYKLAFGYIWDETTATETTPNSIYLDDISVREVDAPATPVTLVSSDPAANATDVAIDKTITLTFSEAVTNASAQNITITPAAAATIAADGTTVTIDPAANLAYSTTYTVTVPNTVANDAGTAVTATSFSFTTVADLNELYAEDFEGSDVADRVGGSGKALQVSRVADTTSSGHFEFITANGNTYLKLMDKYVQPGQYDYGRLNVIASNAVNTNLTGEFAVETKFQIPDLRDGAKYYPITAFYEEGDFTGTWNRGNLAKLVYVVKEGDGFSFKVSDAVPADTTVVAVTEGGTTIATAEAGKWYTLKINFNIDGNAETIDRFTYELTDGTNTYSGMGGAVGNKVGYQSITTDCKYNLTSLHKLGFGYIWDETTASVEDPTTIYLDDISIKNEAWPFSMVSSDPAANASNVAVDKTITLTFAEAVTNASAQNITITPAVDATIVADGTTVTIDPAANLAYSTTYTVTVPNTVVSNAGAAVMATSFSFTTAEEGQIVDPDVILSEKFQSSDVASKIATNNRDAAYTVTRVSDLYAGAAGFSIETDAATGNKYLKLNDIYGHLSGGSDVGRCNIAMEYNTDMNLTGRFSVETKFQIPALVSGAKYFPITAFYEEDKLSGSWNRGQLAKFVYVVEENGSFVFKVSTHVPTTTSEAEVTESGTTIGAAEQGKWYTLKLNFNIDGDAETVDTFTYELTDGTNNYAGNGGAVGNKCGSVAITQPNGAQYELTSLYKLVFGYVWDETTATETTPNSIYLDDLLIKRTYAATYTSSIAANATDVDVTSSIVLAFNREMNDANLDKIIVYEGDAEDKIVCPTTKSYNAEDKSIIIVPESTFKYGRKYTVVVSNQITDVDGINIDKSQFSFTTETLPTDGVTINAPTITGSVVANSVVTGTATFTKNNFASTSDKLTFMAVAYDANGTKVGIAYHEDNFANSNDVALNFNFTIPSTAVGTGSVKLMVWDSFSTMRPVSEVWPAN